MGALIWSGYLKPGQYKVTAKSPCGNYVILETKKGKFIGVEIYGRSLPEVGETFQWKVTKLRGYEREVIPVVEGEGLFPPDGTALPR
ncbi:MAG: hypothetical protein HYT36_02400 [Candidatus Staskawiczbacteria bacterium]|nr:hypothetical protein [Candidatus Staskawiczbacteria bacterium]